MKTLVKLHTMPFDGKHLRICYKLIEESQWACPAYIVEGSNEKQYPTNAPLMPFLTICAHCAALVVEGKKGVIHGAN